MGPMNVPLTHHNHGLEVGTSDNHSCSTIGPERRKAFASYSTAAAVILDFISIAIGTLLGLFIYNTLGGVLVDQEPLQLSAFAAQYAISFMLFGRLHSIYSHEHSLLQVRATAGILRISTYSMLLVSVESFFSKLIVPRLLVLIIWVVVTLLLLLQKSSTRKILAKLRVNEAEHGNVLIIGTGSEARRVFSYLLHSPDQRLRPVAFFEEGAANNTAVIYSNDYQFRDNAPVYGEHLSPDLLADLKITDIFVADPTLNSKQLSELVEFSSNYQVQLSFLASAQTLISGSIASFRIMDGLFVSSFKRHDDSNPGYELIKRILDFVIASCLLVISAPIWLVAAVWVKSTSAGPVLFRQERVGRSGHTFTIYKFRSMYITAPTYGRSPEQNDDPRVTPVGKFLRKTSLDELPQLLNVVRGDMSLVGPRPEMPYVVSEYTVSQRQRLNVPQGLTGIWQLSADRKFAIHESLEYDLYYLENRGLFLDLAILMHTVVFAMKGI